MLSNIISNETHQLNNLINYYYDMNKLVVDSEKNSLSISCRGIGRYLDFIVEYFSDEAKNISFESYFSDESFNDLNYEECIQVVEELLKYEVIVSKKNVIVEDVSKAMKCLLIVSDKKIFEIFEKSKHLIKNNSRRLSILCVHSTDEVKSNEIRKYDFVLFITNDLNNPLAHFLNEMSINNNVLLSIIFYDYNFIRSLPLVDFIRTGFCFKCVYNILAKNDFRLTCDKSRVFTKGENVDRGLLLTLLVVLEELSNKLLVNDVRLSHNEFRYDLKKNCVSWHRFHKFESCEVCDG